jgi:hypothetical protein
VFGSGENAGVDEVVCVELGTRFFRSAFEGEVMEEGGGCVRSYGAGVVFACGAEDGGYYEVVWLRDVLLL